MLRFRAKTLENQHHQWGQLTNEWTADVPTTSLWNYVLREGITHHLAVNNREAAKRRLSDLMFSGAFLDWCYMRLADDYTPLLKIWRVLGIDEARQHYQRAVPALIISHPSQLLLLRQVVEFMRDCKWGAVAVKASEASQKIHIEWLGEGHWETAESQIQWALSLKYENRTKEAIPIAFQALAAQRNALGSDDPRVYVSVNSLASMLNAVNRYEEAAEYFDEAIEARSRLLGPEHPKTLISIASFAHLLSKMGQEQRAEPYHLRAFEGRSKLLGKKHPKTLNSAYNYGKCLMAQGQPEAAIELLEYCVNGRLEVLGRQHKVTGWAINLLKKCRKLIADK